MLSEVIATLKCTTDDTEPSLAGQASKVTQSQNKSEFLPGLRGEGRCRADTSSADLGRAAHLRVGREGVGLMWGTLQNIFRHFSLRRVSA